MKAPLQAIVLGTKLSTLFKQIAAQDSVLHISHIIHVNLVLFYHCSIKDQTYITSAAETTPGICG